MTTDSHNTLISYLREKGAFGADKTNTAKWRSAGKVGMSADDAKRILEGGGDLGSPASTSLPGTGGSGGSLSGSRSPGGLGAAGSESSVASGGGAVNMGMGGSGSSVIASIQKLLGRRSPTSLSRAIGPQPY